MRIVFLIFIFLHSLAWGQTLCDQQRLKSYNPIQGTVPLAYGHMPATDLVCDSDQCPEGVLKGETLLPHQANDYYHMRFEQTRCQWTLADLAPKEDPGIWTDTLPAKLDSSLDNLALNDLDSVDFVSEGWARLGSYRLTVNKKNQYGVPRQFTIILSKNVHNYLLRKSLLRKLGYIVPAVKYVRRLQIKFSSKKEKEDFIKNLSVNNAGSFDRWVLSEKKKEVVVQDVVVMEDQEFRLNLAKGYLSSEIFQGKRIFDSLLIPYALTEVPESINMFDWTVGRIYSENVLLKFPYAKEYNTSKDDAIWMIRRIVKLTEDDWWEIVDSTALPHSVKLLLFEKLKSRRNHLAHLFGVENFNLSVNNTISNSDDLVEGKLVKEFYDGFARRFKIPDPESPLSYSEMVSFFKSKAITTGLELMVNALNSSRYMGTDISQKIQDFNEQLASNVATTVTSGESTKTPVSSFIFPTLQGNLILNREIVAGSYLGTDNLIQLVDSVGASVRVGVFGGITGVYTKTGDVIPDGVGGSIRQFVPAELSANADLYLNRTYAHVKPITSVQKALKYPFKNMLVPVLKNKYGHYFDALMNTDYDKLSEGEKRKVNESSLKLYQDKTVEIESKLNALPKKVQRVNIFDALKSLNEFMGEQKETYHQALSNDDIAQVFLSKIKLFSDQFNKVFVSTDDCRENAGEKINKYFSVLSNSETLLEDGNYPICTSSKKGKVHKKIVQINQLIEAMITEATKHNFRLIGKENENDTQEVFTLLNENLEVGESIIVTDTIGGNLTASAGVDLYNVAKVRMSAKANKILVNRLHIFRLSEDEIHIYKDLGNVNGIEVAMSVRQFIPIMKITFKGTQGIGKTKFYKVKIGHVEDSYLNTPNIHRTEKLKALRKILLSGSVKTLDAIQKPFVVVHKFKENSTKIGLFVWRWNWLNTTDNMTITSPDGHEKKMYRRQSGKTKGVDFENYTKDLVDLLIGKIFNQQFTITSFNEGNPGYTFMGKAKNQIASYEGLYSDDGQLDKPYIKLSNIWNGWKLKKKKALKILKDIKKKYGFDFFEEDVLAQTKELFLYNINVNFFVYNTGLKYALNLPRDKVKKVWQSFQSRNMSRYSGKDVLVRSGYYNFMSLRKKYHKYLIQNDMKRLSKTAIRLVKVVEKNLRLAGIAQIFGGGTNLFAIGKIDGFRVGDENGDKKILSNSFGRVGTEDIDGPIARLKKYMGMTNGEFYMSWLLGRII